jgi:hypothetical protein
MDVTMDVDVVCAVCGEILSGEMGRSGSLRIDPCEKCLNDAYEEGEEEANGKGDK